MTRPQGGREAEGVSGRTHPTANQRESGQCEWVLFSKTSATNCAIARGCRPSAIRVRETNCSSAGRATDQREIPPGKRGDLRRQPGLRLRRTEQPVTPGPVGKTRSASCVPAIVNNCAACDARPGLNFSVVTGQDIKKLGRILNCRSPLSRKTTTGFSRLKAGRVQHD